MILTFLNRLFKHFLHDLSTRVTINGVIGLLCLLLVSCSGQYGRYQQQNDSTPTRLPTVSELQDAIPRVEKISRGGNRNYTVRGNDYHVLKSAKGFSQKGTASWYGNKFHGHLTSNGEIYNMYSMSAAHKNLPLPTYLQVTNLANNKSVVVRVNDRGPFHQSRIIDLSYSAAYKLDMLKTGTASVSITVVDLDKNDLANAKIKDQVKPPIHSINSTTAPSVNFIQVFTTRNLLLAKNTASALTSLYQKDTIHPERDGLYRVQIGPFLNQSELKQMISHLKKSGYPDSYILKKTP
jgi:rare lipoprotein A